MKCLRNYTRTFSDRKTIDSVSVSAGVNIVVASSHHAASLQRFSSEGLFRSGLSRTISTGSQFQVGPVHRLGFECDLTILKLWIPYAGVWQAGWYTLDMTKILLMPIRAVNLFLCVGLFICLVLTLTAFPAAATYSGRPLAADGPTEVTIAVFILDIDEVNSASQSFDANVYIELHWQDPRLVHDNPNEITRGLNEVWNPRLLFINQQKIWPTLPEIVEVFPDGEVVYRQRVWGAFSQPLKLKDFPFDQQVFTIQLGSAGFNPNEVRLIPDKGSRTGIAQKFSLADWDILDWRAQTADFVPSLDEEGFAGFYISIEAKRRYGYFITKVIIPLLLIVMMSWVVFWVDPKESGTQISVAFTTMLTLIAYRFAVGTDLPKISYLSRLDYFILGSTFLVFASLIEVVVTSSYAKIGNVERARAIDRWARVLFPLVFAFITLETLVFRYGL